MYVTGDVDCCKIFVKICLQINENYYKFTTNELNINIILHNNINRTPKEHAIQLIHKIK